MATTFQLPNNRATRLGINILILLAAGIAVRLCQSVFVPLVIAILLACVLAPGTVWLNRHLGIRWSLACITAIFGIIVFTLSISVALFVSVTSLVREVEPTKLSETIAKARQKASDIIPFPIPEGPTAEQINEYFKDAAPFLSKEAARVGVEWLYLWFFILFLLFFLLLEGPTLARRLVEIFGPSAELKAKANEVLLETAQQIRTYIVWRTIINFGLALLMGFIYEWGGLRQAWTWAILLAILNYIPYLGPVLAGLPALADAFVHTPSFGLLLFLIVLYWVIIVLEGYLIVPLVMGRSMDLNATTVMLACLFWELVWGPTGLFLAMPIMAGVKSICTHVPGWWQWANLMSSQEVVAPPEPGTPIAPAVETKSAPEMRLAGDGSPKGAVGAGVGEARQPAAK